MLTEMPVAAVSLNKLSQRVGLAKSNVLNYYESREAILLELLDAESRAWLADLAEAVPPSAEGAFRERSRRLAAAVAATLEARPVLCDLISSQAAVLERNVSTEGVRGRRLSVHGHRPAGRRRGVAAQHPGRGTESGLRRRPRNRRAAHELLRHRHLAPLPDPRRTAQRARSLTRLTRQPSLRSSIAGQLAHWAIAERSGYGSPFAFSHAFKRHFGVPPREYRATD